MSTQQKAGSNGITLYKFVDTGLHPGVCWEFSVNRVEKVGQLFTNVNNMDTFLPSKHQNMMLGVNVVMERDGYREMQVYSVRKMRSATHSLPANAAVPKPLLGKCLLYKGDWNTYNLSRLLFCIHHSMLFVMSAFHLPPIGLLQDNPHGRRTVLRRTIAQQQWIS